ncbi:MAG: hypothetical protein IBX72_09285 [Nitrospirae bacterium]|nr:hypothetical protein [Nitrospirota bacterium]
MKQNRSFIKYLVSSPYGDIPVNKRKWHLPLEYDTLKTPYKTYFNLIREFLARDELKLLLEAASKKLDRKIHLKEVNKISVRSEKHGFLYHPASIEVILKQGKVNPVRKGRALNEVGLSNGVKFGLNVAISDVGKDWLREESSVLKRLNTKFNLPYLPEPYLFSELNNMSFLLEDWFEGYHEFHISRDKDGAQRLKLWDFDHGYKYLSSEQSFELYKQASKILTLYYNFKDYSQILHWHHAAGDFVVRMGDENNSPSPNPSHQGRGNKRENSFRVRVVEDKREIFHPGRGHPALIPSPLAGEGKGEGYFQDKIDVRLTTARRYEPPMVFRNKDPVNPFLGLFSFFLNLTVRMRMDKLNGTGEVAWADDICLEATITGFLEALKLKEELKNYIGSVEEFLGLLKSFGEEELKITFNSIIDLYTGEEYFAVLIENLEEHVRKLYATIQNLP